jgi:4-hydroxybenzoate polyprenyltransferase
MHDLIHNCKLSILSVVRIFMKFVYFEIFISWKFIRKNVWVSIIALGVLSIGLAVNQSLPLRESAINLIKVITYSFFLIYSLEIHTQIFGIEEDKHNKPERPIPSGVISLDEARRRAWIITCIFVILGILLDVFICSSLWIILVLLYSYTSCSKNFALKTLIACLGVCSQYFVVSYISGVSWKSIWLWVLEMFFLVTITMSVQEFRDITGDAAVGRRTLPIVMGEKNARIFVAFACIFSALTYHFFLMKYNLAGVKLYSSIALEILSISLILTVAFRLISVRGPHHDHITYCIWEYWYAACCFSVAFYPIKL